MAFAAQGTADGAKVSMMWIVSAYIILTLGEVLVSTTGLEFAYSQAPASMKGALPHARTIACPASPRVR